MKKIFYFIASAIVALGAVACQNDIEDSINNGQQTEGVSIKVTIAEQSRVALGEVEADGRRKLSFTEGDVLVVRSDWQSGDNYLFTYTKKEGDVYTFTCADEGVSSLVGTQPNIFYLGGLSEQADVDAITISGAVCRTEAEDISGIGMYSNPTMQSGNLGEEGYTVTLGAQPLLKFTANEPVTFKSESYLFFVDGGLVDEYTTKKTGEIYLPVLPSNGIKITMTVTTESGFDKSFESVLDENKIYNLGTIEAPAVSEFGVVGSFQTPTTWDVAKPVQMYETSTEGWVVAKGVELYKTDEFKIVKGNSWAVSYGLSTAGVLALDTETTVVSSNSQNMKAAKNGKFDIYFNATAKKIKYTCVEEFADLKVNITINNKANWSPLYITLKDGNNTIVDKALVSGNVYAISGDYIGQSLSYVLTTSDASKKSEGSVTISKTGAAIELEEVDVVTRIVYKNTQQNQISYWGNKTCLYVWGSGSALDNVAYPGSVMTKDTEANTWYIIIPSSLVGKTINYIINNGGDWKCEDKKLTVKEGDNVLTDSMLGIH
ncbi:MAG: hypothetical protein J6K78_04345 [Tidjanibacter sp.]|nr:hypothetical protein [Tidjanibacter sp.]